MMTNDLEIIKTDTKGFEPGEVFIRGTRYSGEKLYDTETKNSHICPADREYWEPISEEYRAMREELKKAFAVNKVCVDTKYRRLKALKVGIPDCSDTIYSTFGSSPTSGSGSRGVDGTPLSVYRYLAVIYKGAWYRLNFMRMYLDGNKVNCHMNELQYDKDLTDGHLNESGICYPRSCDDGDFGRNAAGNVVWNPDDACYSDIVTNPERVVASFLKFVTEDS